MSKNALALVDCSNRDKLFHYLINTVDRKSTKKEMISPYDDQLIGKMNFRYSGLEHAMFFTYARSSEYPGMKFRNHKIIYLSLDVNEISSAIFNHICNRFGGYIIHNDDVEEVWQKVERQQSENDDDLTLSEEVIAERSFLYEPEEEGKERKVFRELKLEPDVEEEAEEREWAPPVTESKPEKKAEHKKQGNDAQGEVEQQVQIPHTDAQLILNHGGNAIDPRRSKGIVQNENFIVGRRKQGKHKDEHIAFQRAKLFHNQILLMG